MNWYDEDLYDVVAESIEKQERRIEKHKRLIKEQQDLIKQQLENVIFFKKREEK